MTSTSDWELGDPVEPAPGEGGFGSRNAYPGQGDPRGATSRGTSPANGHWPDEDQPDGWGQGGYAGGSGYEPRSGGRYGADAGYGAGYEGPDAHYQDQGRYPDGAGYGAGLEYPDQSGYPQQRGYGGQYGYGYGSQAGYGAHSRELAGYGDQYGYGGQQGYGNEQDYGGQVRYGEQDGYGRQSGYGRYGEDGYWPEEPPFGRHSDGYADPLESTQAYGSARPGAPAYGADAYDDEDRAGSVPSYGRDPYDQDPYGQDPFHGPAGHQIADEAYGQESYAQQPYDAAVADGYGRDAYGGPPAEVAGSAQAYGSPAGQGRHGRQDQYGDDYAGGTALGTSGEPEGDDSLAHRAPGIPAGEWQGLDGEDWREEPGEGLLSRRFGGADDEDGTGGRRGRKGRGGKARKPRRLRGKLAVAISCLAVALVLGVAASFAYGRVQQWITDRYGNYSGDGTGHVQIVVKPGEVLYDLGPQLLSAGVIEAVRPFDSAASAAPNASTLQPGVYVLHYHMNAALAVSLLLSGKTLIADRVTIPEGLRASNIALVLAGQTHEPASAFLQIINHPPASLGLPSYAGGRVEGYLFPDTYNLQPKESPLHILQGMVAEFKQQVSGLNLVAQARKVNLTPAQVIVIASLVQAEGNGKDFGQISRVIDNRLNQGMPLQFDSTVFYAMNKYGTAITGAQEHFPSPYNTYAHTGLPPGPIDSPGLAAIMAALHSPHGPWLYFITNTQAKGHPTYFTGSYAQFQQWQRQIQG